MVREDICIVSKQDGLSLSASFYIPEKPRAILQIAHGMCEHKERYRDFLTFMAEHGYACVIHDHRGHGKSIRRVEDLGFFYENGGENLVEDLHQVTMEAKKRFPGLPCILLGHSMGSLAARCYVKKYDKDIDGLFILGCPSDNPVSGVGSLIAKFLMLFHGGSHGRSAIADYIMSNAFEKAFAQEKTEHAWICSVPEVVHAYNEDPLCNYTFTLNGYVSLLWLVRNTYSLKNWHITRENLPVWFLSGADDPCRVSDKKFYEAVETMKKAGYKKVSAKLYSGMRHEILNEKGNHMVYEEILNSCEKIMDSSGM